MTDLMASLARIRIAAQIVRRAEEEKRAVRRHASRVRKSLLIKADWIGRRMDKVA